MSHQAMATLPFINEAQIEAVLEWGPLMDVLEKAMIAFSAGDVAQPVRQMVQVPVSPGRGVVEAWLCPSCEWVCFPRV